MKHRRRGDAGGNEHKELDDCMEMGAGIVWGVPYHIGRQEQLQKFRLDHIHLKSADVEGTARWYCDVLGAEITFEGQFRGSKVYYLDVSGATLILFGQLESEEVLPASLTPRYGVDHFGFEVEDVDAAVEHLRAKGVRIVEEPVDVRPGLRIAYIEAPDHVRIELSQRG